MILKNPTHPWGWADLINDTHPERGNLLRTFPLFSWCSDPFCMQRSIRLGPYGLYGRGQFLLSRRIGSRRIGSRRIGSRRTGNTPLDTGSQRTYVTQRVAHSLNLAKLRKESLFIKTFASTSTTTTKCDVVEFGLKTSDSEPLEIQSISGTINMWISVLTAHRRMQRLWTSSWSQPCRFCQRIWQSWSGPSDWFRSVSELGDRESSKGQRWTTGCSHKGWMGVVWTCWARGIFSEPNTLYYQQLQKLTRYRPMTTLMTLSEGSGIWMP